MTAARRKVVVIGAGAAGLIAASRAAALGAEVTVIERNHESGRKLLLSGHGRCNVTHEGDTRALVQGIPGNGRFLFSALSAFGPDKLRAYLLKLGVPTKVERGNRVFPESDRAETVRDALLRDALTHGASFAFDERAKDLTFAGSAASGDLRVEAVNGASGRRYPAAAVIVATGGLAYPGTGSTGDGHALAASAGHRIVQPFPSLVPLLCAEDWVKQISGLSLRNVRLTAYAAPPEQGARPLAREQGEMLFTHFGLSGPIVLRASRSISRALTLDGLAKVHVRLDLKPALSPEVLDERVQRDFVAASNREFRNSLGELLPSSLFEPVIILSGIDPHKRVREVTRAERLALVSVLKGIPVIVTGTRGFREAIVTAGGVDTREVTPGTMESRLAGGLFFAGEVLDVDGYTGGFNLQAAFATGWVAGGVAASGPQEVIT